MTLDCVSEVPDQAQGPRIACPLCDAPQHPDVWDALDSGVVQRMNCCACRKEFNFRIDECDRCCHEVAAAWTSQDPPPVVAQVIPCPSCGFASATDIDTDTDDQPF